MITRYEGERTVDPVSVLKRMEDLHAKAQGGFCGFFTRDVYLEYLKKMAIAQKTDGLSKAEEALVDKAIKSYKDSAKETETAATKKAAPKKKSALAKQGGAKSKAACLPT